jgi:hypothetical protein
MLDGSHKGRRAVSAVILIGAALAASAAAYFAYTSNNGPTSAQVGAVGDAKNMLAESDASQVRELVKQMMNAPGAAEAAGQLRQHIDQLVKQGSPAAAPTMLLAVECLAPKFSSFDAQTRQLSLTLLSEILGWYDRSPASCWGALLPPSKSMLHSALADSSADVTIAALRLIAACWQWSPPDAEAPAERKSLGTWKAELHERCVELLDHREPRSRAAAAVTVVSVPIDTAAAKALPLLADESAFVRRHLLLALSERPELLASDDVLPFLNDADAAVRNTADVVLSCRGLSREQIALAIRATNPSPLVRAQAPRYIIDSIAVDRVVWLTQLSRDPAVPVRSEAVRALAQVADADCTARLREMAESDGDATVRQLAGELIRQLPAASRGAAESSGATPVTLPPLSSPKAN